VLALFDVVCENDKSQKIKVINIDEYVATLKRILGLIAMVNSCSSKRHN